MRIAHAHLAHVLERIADVIDARPAVADALRDQPCAPVQIEFAHIRRVLGIRDESKRAHLLPVRKTNRNKPRFVHPPGHFPIPQARERPAQTRRMDAVSDAPARAAAAKAHDEPGLAAGAAIARGKDAKSAVIAVGAGKRLLPVFEARRPHERAVAEDPQVSLRQKRPELAKIHSARNI